MAPRRLMVARRRALIGVLVVLLAAASAAVTSSVTSIMTRPNHVATAAGAPVVLPTPAPYGLSPPPAVSPQVTTARDTCVDVPIIYYHYIRSYSNAHDRIGEQLSVSPQAFQTEMDWLNVSGVHPVTLAQVMAAIGGGAPLPSHPVVLTFDDGHSDFATRAVPVLLHEGFVATAFVVPGFLGRPSYMTDAQVTQVSNQGMVIGAHTMHHVDLNAVSAQVAKIEIDASKSVLQQLTGKPVLDFAYPYGDYDQTVIGLVAQAGFREALATTAGTQQCASNRYSLHRIEASGFYSLPSLMRLAGLPVPPSGWTEPVVRRS